MCRELSLCDFKAVLFDVDGTLVDSLEMIISGLGDAFERYVGHRPGDDEIKGLIGLPISKQLALYRTSQPTAEEVAEMTDFAISRFVAYEDRESVHADAVEVLRLCRLNGIKTALVTSKNAIELDQFMQRFVGAQYVDATVCASDVTHPKPDPESALLACSRVGVDPVEAVMVGDSLYDLRCARAAGVTSIGVSYGSATKEALAAEKPRVIFDSPDALLAWAQDAFLETPCRERK
jgi:HAD superfamily hydrolase (TIGR01549 family)